MLYVCLLFVLVVFCTGQTLIDDIATKCTGLITNPIALSSSKHLKRTLDVNCFDYYNVRTSNEMILNLTVVYDKGINTFQEYLTSASLNEQTLYAAKNWLSMVVTDPYSLYQRQARECNAQLLMSRFGSEDVLSELPVFLQSLEYMESCFCDVADYVTSASTSLLSAYDVRILEAERTRLTMLNAYNNVSRSRGEISKIKETFATNIIETFNKVYSSN